MGRKTFMVGWLRDLHPTGRIMRKGMLFIDEPLTKVGKNGKSSFAMAETISLSRKIGEIQGNGWWRDLVRMKRMSLFCLINNPLCEVMEDARVDSRCS